MKITKNGFKTINLIIGFFIAFAGYYILLMMMANFGMREQSRLLTVPLRLLVLLCLGMAFLASYNLRFRNGLLFFLLFAFLYYGRIVYEALHHSSTFQLPVASYFLYFTSFVFLPILLTSQLDLEQRDYTYLFYTVLIGCLIMSVTSYIYYQDLLGEVIRIKTKLSESNISPLALSYVSVLGIGVCVSYLLTNRVKKKAKILIYFTVLLCMIPFFLGASRGSVVALLVPFIFYALFQEGLKTKILLILALVILGVIFVFAAQYLGTGIFKRLTGERMHNIMQYGSEASPRLQIWISGWEQFLKNPILGNSLNVNSVKFYPHNILLETLITTGFIGFSFYVLFLLSVLRKCIWIMKSNPAHFALIVIFLQALVQGMFSGGLYSTSWLAISGGVILGYKKN